MDFTQTGLPYLGNMYEIMFPMQQATWTRGPSFPNDKPDATEKTVFT